MELRFNESLHNEILDITNDFLYPGNSKIYEKEPRYNETSSRANKSGALNQGSTVKRKKDAGDLGKAPLFSPAPERYTDQFFTIAAHYYLGAWNTLSGVRSAKSGKKNDDLTTTV